MRDYELVVLLHPDLEIDLDKPIKNIERIITANKGKVQSKDIWGKRKLAYQIAKEDFAVYVYFDIQLPTQSVSKVDMTLNITDEVLRHLITTPVPKPEEEDEEEKKEEDKDSKAESAKSDPKKAGKTVTAKAAKTTKAKKGE